jgi:hypothetical protein
VHGRWPGPMSCGAPLGVQQGHGVHLALP